MGHLNPNNRSPDFFSSFRENVNHENGGQFVSLAVSYAVRTFRSSESVFLCRQLPARLPDPFCVTRATFSAWKKKKNMSADRKAGFKQPPRHVTDTTLSQEVRRVKVRRYVTKSYNRLHSHERGRRWRSKNACDTSLLHREVLFNAYRIFRDGRSAWRASATLIYLPT
jgi:hypothetical protein